MREAAKKTFGSSKSMVEKSAKSAAGAVGNVVHKTSQKVTESGCTGYACTPDELWIEHTINSSMSMEYTRHIFL